MNDGALKQLLDSTRTVAVVGISKNWNRPSNFVAKYLKEHGYTIIPVNPKYENVLGMKCYPSLSEVPLEIDLVNCFRKPKELNNILVELLDIGVKKLWLQIGVINSEIKEFAERQGVSVVMDRCIKIEHARLFGGLNFVGVNTKVISSKRSRQVYN
tara:strand:+ start:40 stop:507 length:468 start_codon:yes stop_codon:yes gene_type:complete